VWSPLAKQITNVNPNVNEPMAPTDEQIRVSGRVKRILDRRRHEGKSYNDVLKRVLGDDADGDFNDGFGR
jgi:hypothetical protein